MLELTESQIRDIYKNHFVHDFPLMERKPLKHILGALSDGNYKCLGMQKGGKLCAYAFVIQCEAGCLLDYFAVFPELRGKGIGSDFLKQLAGYLKEEVIIIEVENPAFAKDSSERETQLRRIDFYLGNGCRETDVRSSLLGVEYKLLILSEKEDISAEELREMYREIYRAVLPVPLYSTLKVR